MSQPIVMSQRGMSSSSRLEHHQTGVYFHSLRPLCSHFQHFWSHSKNAEFIRKHFFSAADFKQRAVSVSFGVFYYARLFDWPLKNEKM